MDYNQNINNLQEEDKFEGSEVDIRELLEKYLAHWKWFVLSLIISFLFAYYKLNFARPQYEAVSTVKIKDEKGGDASTLSVFQDLGMLGGSKNNIDDEIEILKSKSIISETIKSLKFNVRLYTDKNNLSNFLDGTLGFDTEFYENERYKNPPLRLNFFMSDSALYKVRTKFYIQINSASHYTFIDAEKSIEKRHAFGKKMTTNFGDVIIIPNTDLKKSGLIGNTIVVHISTLKSLTNSYLEKLNIEPKSDFSSVLSLEVSDGVKAKAEDFLNELVNKYNERAIQLKDALSKSTSDFVTERLEIISEELSDVDFSAESIKTRYRLSDAASQTGLNLQSGQDIENRIVQANTELQKISFIKDFVSSKGNNDVIPVDVGVADNGIASTMQQYNQLMMEKQRLLKTSTEKNPTVVNVDEQLQLLRGNINQGLNNLESSQKISLEALNRQDAIINSRLYSAPKQERQVRDIQRQQQIKEALYLYLLQKREETAITLGVADPNAKVIDYAESFPDPIAPKKKIFYLVAIFAGLLIPFGIIYSLDMLDSKVHTREEVEKVLNIPILGDIPKLESSKEGFLISPEDNSSIAEAFRILRTNLNFVLDSNVKGKTIFVTSTIAHEGKSLVSANLAASLAHAGKKTLLLGMDIRAPKIVQYLNIRGDKGVTNFIVNSDLDIDDIIVKSPKIKDLDIISSGDIAPNPAELLMNPRVQELFQKAKEEYEYIIVDTAAFSMVTDTMLLSNLADSFIYVIRANYLDKRFLKYIKSIYKDKRLPNLSLLINGVDHKKSYGYGYGYGYGANFDKANKPWWKFNS